MQIEKEKEFERRNVEIAFLLLYTALALLLLANAIVERQIEEALIWVLPELALSWGIYLLHYQNYKVRALLMTLAVIITFFWYGTNVESVYNLMPVFAVVLLMIGLFNQPGLLVFWAAGTFLLLEYRTLIREERWMDDTESVVLFLSELGYLLLLLILEYTTLRKNELQNRQLKEAVGALKQTEHDKDEFMANVSHEIRTPLNTICGMSELVLSEGLPPKIEDEMLDILVAGKSLQGVVSNVLDYSELETGKLDVVETPYNFSSVLNDVLSIAAAANEEKKLELIVDCDANIPYTMVGDSDKLTRVIVSVMGNAIKFTERGCVVLKASAREEAYGVNLSITIKDTGIGMDSSAMKGMFTSFNRINPKKDYNTKGIGLGMAIAKKLVELMNGFIMVKSDLGEGSEFRIIVPQKVQDARPMVTLKEREELSLIIYINQEKFGFEEIRDSYNDAIANAAKSLEIPLLRCNSLLELKSHIEKMQFSHLFVTMDEYREDKDYFIKLSRKMPVVLVLEREENTLEEGDFYYIYKPLSVLSVAAAVNGQRVVQSVKGSHLSNQRFIAPEARILLVDDNRMNLKVVKALLRPYQMQIYTASSGKEALQLIDRMKYDMIFLDHMMPEMDGVEVMHEIRKRTGSYYVKLPIICLTANAVGGAREMLMQEGFDDYLTKPVELSGLERVLKNYLPKEKIKAQEQMPAKEEIPEQESEMPAPSCIDYKLGITYVGGNKEDYRDIVRTFYKIAEGKQKELQEAYAKEDWENYAIYVHALKSTALGIGAKELSELAKYQEVAAKVRDINAVRTGFSGMMELYAKVLDEIEAEPEFGVAEQKRSGLWEIAESALREKIEQLSRALDDGKSMLAEKAIEELSEYSYRGMKLYKELEPVREAVSRGEFESAANWVEILKGKVEN